MASTKIALIVSLTIFIAFSAAIQDDNESDQSKSLMNFLRHFNRNRHHVTNPEGKQKARDFIKKTFKDLGLITWSEQFKPDFPQYSTGVNIIGMLSGTLAGSSNDRPFLIGAHYDTMRTTAHGANDNGSGVTAMLQVAKQMATNFQNRARSFSVLFVAFDFEEWENCSDTANYPKCACGEIDCGSRAFVANFTRFYNGSLKSNGKLQGAIIMDTVMNYNNTPNSQILPPSTERLLPEVYGKIKANGFRGDFLAVAGRVLDDAALMNAFWYHYGRVKSALGDKTTMYPVNLLFYGQPYKLPPLWYNTLGDFLRSDHVSFWNSDPSMSAIFLSDTADHRSYMVSCYHQDCDNINRVTSEMLQFLQKTSDSIVAVANDVTKLSCPESGTIIHSYSDNSVSGDTGMKAWEVALLSVGIFILGMLISAVAVVFYHRWKKQHGPLITGDLPQSSANL